MLFDKLRAVHGGSADDLTVATQSEDMETRYFKMMAEPRARESLMLVGADGSQLAGLANLIAGGELRVFVAEVFPLARAREAYARA